MSAELVDIAVELAADAEATMKSVRIAMIAVSLISALGGFALAHIISRSQIVQPLDRVVGNLTRVAEGNLDVRVDGIDRRDEIGALNRTLQHFITVSRERIEQIRKDQENARRELERAATVKELTDAFEAQIEISMATLASAAEELEATASSMATAAEEGNAQTQSVSGEGRGCSHRTRGRGLWEPGTWTFATSPFRFSWCGCRPVRPVHFWPPLAAWPHRSRRALSNAQFLAKFGFDTAENEPCQVSCPEIIFGCCQTTGREAYGGALAC